MGVEKKGNQFLLFVAATIVQEASSEKNKSFIDSSDWDKLALNFWWSSISNNPGRWTIHLARIILSVILLLKHDYNIIDDYLIKRPWDKVFDESIKMSSKNNNFDLIDYISNKGIDGKSFIIKLLEPLLSSCNINIDIMVFQ